MRNVLLYSLLSLFLLSLSACSDDDSSSPTKPHTEKPIEYNKLGNKALYTADGERELIDEDCD
ncbi:MAG: hypothetical protein KAG28_07975 [Cocleimonas sp.]|nr:hypothetical protein [Cocleimonas sp.]